MPDIASIGLGMDSRPVVEGTKALDALGASATAVEPKIDKVAKAADGMSEASAKVWRYGTDAAKAVEALGAASARTGERTQATNGQMSDTAKIMQAQATEARAAAQANVALGASSQQMTIGSQLFIEKLREQAATVGMSRSQLAAYQAAQLGVSREAEASVAKLKAYEEAIKGAADAKAQAAKQTNVLTDAIKILAAGYGALKLTEYIKDAALLAARYETLGIVSTVVGKNAGYTKTQMDTATDAIARQGITMIESRQSAIKLVQAHVDLTNATGLARIAQDAAVIGNINSSEAFDRLVNGVARGNTLILRNIGINVNLQAAYQQMAAELGKSTKELTENERVQARLNAVLERGTDIAGTYEASMDTAGKQLKSMQRYTEDLKTVIGETFTEVLTIGVMALTDHLKDANKEVNELSKNQQLHEWGRSLADVFIWVANKVGNATTLLQQASAWADHKSARDDIDSKYKGLANDNAKNSSFWDIGFSDSGKRLAAAKAAEMAEENVAYVTQQAKLAGQYDAFAKAGAERETVMTAKHKAEADARLKVDTDYAEKSRAVQVAYAGYSLKIQQDAQMALAKSVYVGTPTFRDTEGREPKAKVNQVESTELADRLARIQDLVGAEKQMYDTMSKMDDMFHAAGKMGDAEYYQNKRDYAAAAAKDQIDGYTKQIADLRAYHNATAAEAAKHAKQINDIEAKRAAAGVNAQDEQNLLTAKESLRLDAIASASEDATNKYLAGLDQEAKKLEESNAAHETSKGAVERENIARLDAAIAAQQQFMAEQVLFGATDAELAQAPVILKYLEDVRAARARIAAGMDQQQAGQFKDKMADQAIKDWQRAGQSIADSLTSAFGAGGKALGGMFQAYAKGMEGQLRAQKDLALAKKQADDDPAKIEAINRAQLAGAQSQIQGYAGMTSAAQGFFAEGSRGYQAMHAATVALQGAEIALSLIKGVNAVLTQGEGDPYSAFVRMAAMAAIVTGLGVALSGGGGGGGGQSAADVQKAQGTGSVFGDSSAKSDSVRHSIEQMSANTDLLVPINQGMLTSLKAIEASMVGLTNLVVRTPGVTDGTNMGIQTGTIGKSTGASIAAGAQVGSMIGGYIAGPVGMMVGAIGGAIVGGLKSIWGKTTQNIVDSGLQYGGSVRSLQDGKGFDQYASVDTTKSSFFGLSKSTSNSVQTQGLNDELSKQFGLIFTNLDKSLQAASVALGGSAADVTKVLDGLTLESTKVSLKGLTGTALTDALNSVISKSMDDIASAAFPQMDQFRKVGEGYAETVMRIAGDYAKLDSILAATGTTFGPVGMASLAAREHLIELAGGIDQLNSQTNSFSQNFLSKAEQLAPVQKYVTDQLAAMGLQSLTTRDQFKDYALGLANSGALATDAGAQQYASLMALSEAFAKTHAATVDLTKSEQEVADERTDLQNKLDDLTMSQAQLAEKAEKAISSHNLALYQQVQAAELLEKKRAMEITLMELTGDKAGALAANRATELAGMSAALRPTQELIYAQQDLAAATQETATILGLQAQMYAANGDKVSAAAVLEQQHAASLVGLTPAVAAATQATWAAQAAEKAKKDALDESNAILGLQAQLLASTGDKAGAAAVLEQQHINALTGLTPAVAQATKELWAAQAAEKFHADAMANRSAVLTQQAAYYTTINDKASLARVTEDQRTASLVGQTAEVANWTRMAWAAADAEKARTNALAESNAILQLQAQTAAATGDQAAAAAVLEQQHTNAMIGLSPAVADATRTMWAAEQAAKAKASVDSLTVELLNAQGLSQEAVNLQRRAEIAALSDTERALKESTYAAIDKAKTGSLQVQLLQAQGNDAAATVLQRQQALAALGVQDRALQQAIYDAQDKHVADQQAAQVAAAMAQAQQQAAEESKRAAEALKSAWQGLTDSITDEVKRIRGLIDGGGEQSYASSQAAFAIATGQARSGDQDAAKLLPSLSKAMLDLAEANAVTSFDLRLARAQAAASLTQTNSIIAAQFGLKVPSFDVGTDYISQTGLALVHQGESITPAASNRPYTQSNAGGGNAELVAEIRALRAEVAALRSDNSTWSAPMGRDMKRVADTLEIVTDGGNAMRTKEEA
ncbi:hypothetical protein [Duganella violaceipulchra]|uniref:Bacteriophage tail tape measure N-terminal domain-containing protein n=1 Tax=Duganella violaceipulchra TaxID=2849652 RepID=A0AA41L034_9BURK|nr:hypothetical protein [Duganella violaceicalia]MBV6321896.1 hypothetical protein [Duganella violaceicalia]MCP2007110.1 hypothetical protein [Duganella violaceicalia]